MLSPEAAEPCSLLSGVALDGETVVGVVLIKLCGDNASSIGCAEVGAHRLVAAQPSHLRIGRR